MTVKTLVFLTVLQIFASALKANAARRRTEISTLISEIQDSINVVNEEIRQTEYFLKNIRSRIFPKS